MSSIHRVGLLELLQRHSSNEGNSLRLKFPSLSLPRKTSLQPASGEAIVNREISRFREPELKSISEARVVGFWL